MKKGKLLLIGSFIMVPVLMAGCKSASDEVKTSLMTVNSDLSLHTLIVEEFDESLYDAAELKSMMDEEAAEYDSQNGSGAVTAGEVSVADGFADAEMDYGSAEDYAGFNSRYLKLMTLADFISEGSPNIAFRSVKDDTKVDITTLTDEDLCVLVTDESGEISFPGKIKYISDGVDVLAKNEANVDENMDGLAYIIFINK